MLSDIDDPTTRELWCAVPLPGVKPIPSELDDIAAGIFLSLEVKGPPR